MWIFESSTGCLTREGILLAKGYAGNGDGKNNPAMQDIRDIGPLPVGFYTICAPRFDSKTGIFTLDLIPDAANQMFGRSEFRIHGDRRTGPPGLASEGCIVLPMFARERIWDSNDTRLQVVAVIVPAPIQA